MGVNIGVILTPMSLQLVTKKFFPIFADLVAVIFKFLKISTGGAQIQTQKMLFQEPKISRSNESKVFREIPETLFDCVRKAGCAPDSLEREISRLNLGTPGCRF